MTFAVIELKRTVNVLRRQMKKIAFSLLCFLMSAPLWVFADGSVERAFSATNVKYVPFNAAQSNVSKAEKEFLNRLFNLVGKSVVKRVDNFQRLHAGKTEGVDIAGYSELASQISAVAAPPKLEKIKRLIVDAIQEQVRVMSFAQNEIRQGRSVNMLNEPRVRSSSSMLHQAHQQLIQLYPKEGSQNKEAFEKYLCALDLI